MSASLVLVCDRTDCDDRVEVPIAAHDLLGRSHSTATLADVYGDAVRFGEAEPGWGWDYNGLDAVVHCPAHRTGGS